MRTTNRSPRPATLVSQACANVQGFHDLIKRLKRRIKTSGKTLALYLTRHPDRVHGLQRTGLAAVLEL